MFDFFLQYLTDPILRAPTVGSMLLCLVSSLIGVVVFLRKQSLLGECLSHASYPGVILGALAAGYLSVDGQESIGMALLILIGAALSSLCGLWSIQFLKKRLKVRDDSALCFVLAAYFGVGLTLASRVQFTHTSLYKKIQAYLYGQAATMTDQHIAVYGIFSFAVILIIFFFYKELQTLSFDGEYAQVAGMKTALVDKVFFFLIVLAIVLGIRCVGVVLMSAMLIAPAVAARQCTHQLSKMFWIAALVGVASGFMGNIISVEFSTKLALLYPGQNVVIPTGPMIVLVSSLICLLCLAFARERGMVSRLFRAIKFRYKCTQENLLKTIWRISPEAVVMLEELQKFQHGSSLYLRYVLWRLKRQGWINHLKSERAYQLTQEGIQKAAHIVRLHRLWELYLTECVGVGIEKVHRNAEEMEHIITPYLEDKLTELLQNPQKDPHQQPIPPREEPKL